MQNMVNRINFTNFVSPAIIVFLIYDFLHTVCNVSRHLFNGLCSAKDGSTVTPEIENCAVKLLAKQEKKQR